jgi:hypothetical protein
MRSAMTLIEYRRLVSFFFSFFSSTQPNFFFGVVPLLLYLYIMYTYMCVCVCTVSLFPLPLIPLNW